MVDRLSRVPKLMYEYFGLIDARKIEDCDPLNNQDFIQDFIFFLGGSHGVGGRGVVGLGVASGHIQFFYIQILDAIL